MVGGTIKRPLVGGTFHASFTNFSTGSSHSFGGEYHELVPGERIRYTDHFDDPNLPVYPSMFFRHPGSLVGAGQELVRPHVSEQFDYEGEIALVIGREGRHVPKERAGDYIPGYTLCNEGSVRDWMRHGKFNVTQGKNFDRSGSIGPWIVTDLDVSDLAIRTRHGGERATPEHSLRSGRAPGRRAHGGTGRGRDRARRRRNPERRGHARAGRQTRVAALELPPEISGQVAATAGSVSLGGRDLSGQPASARTRALRWR